MSGFKFSCSEIGKSFGGVRALKGVSFEIREGETLAIVGENGAGKSTLMKILSGVWPYGTYEGELRKDSDSLRFHSTKDAQNEGIHLVHQELALFEELSIAENLYLTNFPTKGFGIDREQLLSQAAEVLQKIGFSKEPTTLVKYLNIAERQLIEIGKGLVRPLKVLILDEPTSTLADQEIERLFELLRNLRAFGTAIIYISHKLNEVKKVCDRAIVLRDGERIREFSCLKDVANDELIEAMTGRQILQIFPPKRDKAHQKKILEVESLDLEPQHPSFRNLHSISFDVKEGEIVGLSGLLGSGRTEILLSIMGFFTPDELKLRARFDGQRFHDGALKEHGLALLTEDRRNWGLFPNLSIRDNMSISSLSGYHCYGQLCHKRIAEVAQYFAKVLRLKAARLDGEVLGLSGGNQQKVLLARCLAMKPKLLLLDEPTRGIDVGAKSEIYHFIRELADQGMAILMVSSELPEIVHLSDRVYVIKEGRVSGELTGDQITNESIMTRAVA